MRLAFATLKDWFKDGSRLIEVGNKHQRVYVDASNPSAFDFENRKKALLNDPEGLVLLAYGDNFSLARSFKQFGGTLYRPEDKVICLFGLHDQAFPFEVNVESLLEEIETVTPTIGDILACKSIAELKSLEVPTKITRGKKTEHQSSNCSALFLPPWAKTATLDFKPEAAESKEELSLALILNLKEAGEVFNKAHADEGNPVDSREWIGFAARWLWLNRGVIDKANLVFASNDPEASEFSTQRHKQCVLPPITASCALGNLAGGTETLAQFSSEILKFTESNTRSNALRVKELERAEEPEENKKNPVAKWVNFNNKLMILNMMSDDGITTVTDFTEEFKQLMNAGSLDLMGKIFHWQLSQQGLGNIHISESALRQIYYGDIFSTMPGTIKGRSPFTFNESAESQANQSEELTMLHIAYSTCTTKSLEDIRSDHHKDLIKVPSNFYELEKSLKMYIGPITRPYTKFLKFLNDVRELKGQITEMAKNDSQIFAKIAYAQNLFFQQFAKECRLCENREDVNEKALPSTSTWVVSMSNSRVNSESLDQQLALLLQYLKVH